MTASKVTQSKLTTSSEVRLVEVLDAYMAAVQEGQAPSRDELLAEHPELAEDLDACLASLEFIQKASLAAPPLVLDSPSVGASEGEPGIGDLGDFRLIAEIGRGGMGVVYEAVQRSLNRRVALKVLPFAAAMDPTQLRRFHTEALAAAQLHHTHIVPVYSVGCERGVHYYAMQFIEGQTLAQVIAERRRLEARTQRGGAPQEPKATDQSRRSSKPTVRNREFFRPAAALGIQAAVALDHAHKFGIVHRDVKPANLLVDVQGNLWVTDFGLARLQDDTGLTMTGDLLGTLRYMSPEQALGKRMVIDHRTDIYSLGATLYELVTLRPAIEGQDRQEVLRKVAQDEPATPRRVDPAIPRELETILLKAMNKEPASRYDTAQELADDLARFLGNLPIRATRPSLLERGAKWSRRHPAILVTVVSGLLLAVIGLTASLIAVNREKVRTSEQARKVKALASTLEWELYASRVSQAQGDWYAGNPARAESALKACPVELRGWEWRYAWKLCHQELYSVFVHDLRDGMDCVPLGFARDGKSWISAAGTSNLPAGPGSLKCCDTRTGACVWDRDEEHLTSIRTLAISPAGGVFAMAFSDEQLPIQLRDVGTGRLVGALPSSRRWQATHRLAFSPDGKSLAQLRDRGTLVMWDVASRTLVFEVRAHPDVDTALAFHPSGHIVATGGRDGVIRLWNAHRREELKALKGHDWIVLDVTFSPDGSLLASGGRDQTLRVWDVERGVSRMVFSGHDGFVYRVAYTPDGTRLVAACGQAITVRDSAQGRELFSLRGHSHYGSGLAFAPDGSRLAVSSRAGSVHVFDPAVTEPQVLAGVGWINSVSFSADGASLLAAEGDSAVTVWDLKSGRRTRELMGHDDTVRTALFTPDGARIVSACWDGSIRIWDAATGKKFRTLAASDRPRVYRALPGGIAINGAAVSPDGRVLATVGWDRKVQLWDLATWSKLRSYGGHEHVVWCVAISPDSRLIASVGEDRRIRVWDLETSRDIWSVASNYPETGAVTVRQVLSFSPDGKLLAGCAEFGPNPSVPVKIWEATTGAEVQSFHNPGGQINALAFSPDGARLATASENRTVQVWDVETGQNVLVLRGHIGAALSVAFSPDGTKLASGSVDDTIRIWNAPSMVDTEAAAPAPLGRSMK